MTETCQQNIHLCKKRRVQATIIISLVGDLIMINEKLSDTLKGGNLAIEHFALILDIGCNF